MMCMASMVQGDLKKIEADLDRANELAAAATGSRNAVDRALEQAAESVVGSMVRFPDGVKMVRMCPAAEVQPAGPVAELKVVGLDDFMTDPYDFSPGDQAWMGGLERKDGGGK